MKAAHLFVYGTLRRRAGSAMYPLLACHAAFVGEASYQGVMYKVGRYPGVVPSRNSSDQVRGEVYRLRQPALVLPQLDRYEQCRPDLPERAEYIRERQAVRLRNGKRLTAWVYLYNRPVERLPRVPSGDFLKAARR